MHVQSVNQVKHNLQLKANMLETKSKKMLDKIKECYRELKDEFLEECRRHALRMDEEWFDRATSLTTGRNRNRWQIVMTYNHEGKKRTRTVGLVPEERVARKLIRLYSTAKHLFRAAERLQELVEQNL